MVLLKRDVVKFSSSPNDCGLFLRARAQDALICEELSDGLNHALNNLCTYNIRLLCSMQVCYESS